MSERIHCGDSRPRLSVERSSTASSSKPAALGNQLQCRLTDPLVIALAMEELAPSQRRDVAIFVHGFVGDKAQLLAQRGAGVGIGPVFEQQAGEGSIPLPPAEVGLRDNPAKQRGVPAETVGVDLGPGVHVGTAFDEPAGDLNLIEIGADVQ